MRKTVLGAFISLTVPLFLFVNVWQSQRYMINYFEVKGLIKSQEALVEDNKKLINRVAELESPERVSFLLDSQASLRKIGGGEIVRIEVVGINE